MPVVWHRYILIDMGLSTHWNCFTELFFVKISERQINHEKALNLQRVK